MTWRVQQPIPGGGGGVQGLHEASTLSIMFYFYTLPLRSDSHLGKQARPTQAPGVSQRARGGVSVIGLLNPEGGREWLYTLALAWARAQVGRLRLGYLPPPAAPPWV